MKSNRMEAFSDGVMAIIITIMVLELKVPHVATLEGLGAIAPIFLAYVLSFINVGIYWNNHHHLFMATSKINGATLWANLFLLFWLSLLPFASGWMGENRFARIPVAIYGVCLLMSAVAYTILARNLIGVEGTNSKLAVALNLDFKGKASLAIYAVAIPLAFANRWLALALYGVVAVIWFVPDSRIEKLEA